MDIAKIEKRRVARTFKPGLTDWPQQFRAPRDVKDDSEIARLKREHEFLVCEGLLRLAIDHDPVWIFEKFGWVVGIGAEELIDDIKNAHCPGEQAAVQATLRARRPLEATAAAEHLENYSQCLIHFLVGVVSDQRKQPNESYKTRKRKKSPPQPQPSSPNASLEPLSPLAEVPNKVA